MADGRFLAVELDGQALLLAAETVQQVLGRCQVVEVPHISSLLRGVFLYNGRAVPLLELGGAGTARDRRRTIVFQALGEWAGLAVDDVSEVLNIPKERLQSKRHSQLAHVSHEFDDGHDIRPVIDLVDLVGGVLELSASHHFTAGSMPAATREAE